MKILPVLIGIGIGIMQELLTRQTERRKTKEEWVGYERRERCINIFQSG
jgi:hypothetical protein